MANTSLSRPGSRMSALFDDFFKPWADSSDAQVFPGISVPAVNITQDKEAFNVLLAAPGMKKEDFQIDIDGNILSVRSEKQDKKEEKDKEYTRREFSYSSFSRSFTLPDEVQQDKITARYADGVLTITLPRLESNGKTANRKITIS